jgi:hypothetical protein
MLSLAAGSAYLARGAVADGADARIALCRFYADNLLVEAGALKERILGGAASLAEAGKALVSA